MLQRRIAAAVDDAPFPFRVLYDVIFEIHSVGVHHQGKKGHLPSELLPNRFHGHHLAFTRGTAQGNNADVNELAFQIGEVDAIAALINQSEIR